MTALVGGPGAPVTGRGRRITAPVLLAGAVLAVSVLLHVRDPHRGGSYLFCPWLLLTGTYCPGCGGLRAVNDLTHGELVAAASSNFLFVASIPVVLMLWTRWLLDRWRGVQRMVDQRRGVLWACAFAGVALAFWVVRNLPGLEWLTP